MLMLLYHKRVLFNFGVLIGSPFFINCHCAMVLRLHKMVLFYILMSWLDIKYALVWVGRRQMSSLKITVINIVGLSMVVNMIAMINFVGRHVQRFNQLLFLNV